MFKQRIQAPRHVRSSEKMRRLLAVFDAFPFQWKQIQESFPDLTIDQLKNKVNSLKVRETSFEEEDEDATLAR